MDGRKGIEIARVSMEFTRGGSAAAGFEVCISEMLQGTKEESGHLGLMPSYY